MDMTNQEYAGYIKKLAPSSPLAKDLLNAFWVGGAICVLGQLLHNLWALAGLSEDLAGTATSVSLIFLSALVTGLNVYDNVAKLAGAGTLVPITGFANAVVSPALDFRTEGMITGLAARMFTVAGPVLVYGTLAGVLYGAALSGRAGDLRKVDLSRAAVAVGSEGRGLSPELLALCDGEVIIPMNEDCESLNVAAAAAILMWELTK